jgi:hypothetical protein
MRRKPVVRRKPLSARRRQPWPQRIGASGQEAWADRLGLKMPDCTENALPYRGANRQASRYWP